MDKLPIELRIKILEQLEKTSDLTSAALSCRKMLDCFLCGSTKNQALVKIALLEIYKKAQTYNENPCQMYPTTCGFQYFNDNMQMSTYCPLVPYIQRHGIYEQIIIKAKTIGIHILHGYTMYYYDSVNVFWIVDC